MHLGIGAVGGAVYGLGREVTGRRYPAALVGLGFGTGFWGFAYVVAAPALHLFPSPWKESTRTPPGGMLAAHALFGVATALLVARTDRREDDGVSLPRPAQVPVGDGDDAEEEPAHEGHVVPDTPPLDRLAVAIPEEMDVVRTQPRARGRDAPSDGGLSRLGHT